MVVALTQKHENLFKRKFDALSKIEEKLKNNLSLPDLFLETVKDYFVNFNVAKTGENTNKSSTNTMLVYSEHGVDIYGPTWLAAKANHIVLFLNRVVAPPTYIFCEIDCSKFKLN